MSCLGCRSRHPVGTSDVSGRETQCLSTHLETALAEELVACAEGHLDDAGELRHLLRRVVLDVGDALGLVSTMRARL